MRRTLKLSVSIILLIFLISPNLYSQTLDERVESIINKMSLQEKILQLHQEGGFNTADNTRLGIPGFIMADGPHGVRDGKATSFPVGISMAATWNPDLIFQVGLAMGKEFRGKGKHQALGPCMDLTRDPRNGRTAESGGEDPFLCAKITSALIKGIQSAGCIATAKHFNGVYRQDNRTENNYLISQRNLMEYYGLNFRSAVQEAGVMSVMNSYNLINGKKAAENKNLLTNILRDYWGFPYYVVSDWGSIWDSKAAIEAGCNVCMGSANYENDLFNLVNSGQISIQTINDAVRKVLRTKILCGMQDYLPSGNPADINSEFSKETAYNSAKESIILLKNEGNILPLNKNEIKHIAVIGPSADIAQIDGSGSSYVSPFYSVTPLSGIINKTDAEKISYLKGCDINSSDMSGFADAVKLADTADVVIYIGGLDLTQEGEGFDRVGGSIELPGKQKDLIKMLASVNNNIIVILESGGICGVNDFVNNIKGLIYAFYPGQEGGNALADVIFGDYNPAGRLPVTMPMNDTQLPERNFNFDDDFGGGYRWFDQQNLTPQFVFGYGLSYSEFEYSNLILTPESAPAGTEITAKLDVKNISQVEGDEVVQLYITDTESSVFMPEKQLKGFRRIHILPGETKTVSFKITSEELYYYDESLKSFEVEPGEFTVRIGSSSGNLPLSKNFTLTSSVPKPDLKIVWIKTMPAFPVKGDTVVFLAAIKNEGTGDSPALIHRVNFYKDGREVSSSNKFNNSLKPGSMVLVSADAGIAGENGWIAQNAGTTIVSAIVDPEKKINEWNENNNKTDYSFIIYNKPPENIAKFKEAVVSSIESTDYTGNYATDGNMSTRWSSQFTDNQFIYIDLGFKQHINKINIYWETAFGKDYEIQISDDAENWETIEAINNSDGGLDVISKDAECRYVKMKGIHRATEWGYSMYEFEVYDDTKTSIGLDEISKTTSYFLEDNYPNPFNASTQFHFAAAYPNTIKIQIFNLTGQLIRTLVDGNYSPGMYVASWDGKDNFGNQAASGIYFYQMRTGNFAQTKKMIMLK